MISDRVNSPVFILLTGNVERVSQKIPSTVTQKNLAVAGFFISIILTDNVIFQLENKTSKTMPKIAITDQEILNCFDVISELRPNLIRSDFLKTIRDMENNGFRLVYIIDAEEVVAVAGYRITTNLFMGKHLYVDDLVTAEKHRSAGYGKKLINWLKDLAKTEACTYLHLDSGTHRGRAHKFYFEQGFTIASYHFSQELRKD